MAGFWIIYIKPRGIHTFKFGMMYQDRLSLIMQSFGPVRSMCHTMADAPFALLGPVVDSGAPGARASTGHSQHGAL